jgi:hypothetical protein
MARILGIVLVVLGLLGFFVGDLVIPTGHEQVAEVGPLEVTKETEERIPTTPLVSGLVLLAGVGVLVYDRVAG